MWETVLGQRVNYPSTKVLAVLASSGDEDLCQLVTDVGQMRSALHKLNNRVFELEAKNSRLKT